MSEHMQTILALGDELTEPTMNREPYHIWDTNRHKQIRHHITVLPGLLAQLYQSVHPTWSTTDEPGGAIPASRPPLELEALSRHAQITTAATAWCAQAGIDARPTPESTIRALVGATNHLDTDQQHTLIGDLRRWRGWCRVYLELDKVEAIRDAPCPLSECAGRGTLRVNLTTAHALCTACGATWSQDTIGVLGEHIRISRNTKAQHV